ncbi:MAG: cytochrome c5 family protein [Sphingomonadales bacterium]
MARAGWISDRVARMAGLLGVVLTLQACGEGGDEMAPPAAAPASLLDKPLITAADLPMPTDPDLVKGREIWAGTCQPCHGSTNMGAPRITDTKAWAPRIAQGTDVLLQHAINGHYGPSGTMMPPRGGNEALTDDDLRLAIGFMVANSKTGDAP